MTERPQPVEEKRLNLGRVGVSESIGLRSSQEDTHVVVRDFAPEIGDETSRSFFAVFDGHGGSYASEYARDNFGNLLSQELASGNNAENSLKNAYMELDRRIEETDFAYGCTAATVLVEGGDLITANAGDTRVLLISLEDGKVERISKDHRLQDKEEARRVLASGANVANGRIYKAGASINVARALGDKFFGNSVSPEPFVSRKMLSPGKYKLILECDGVWNALSDEEVPDLIAGKNAQDASQAMIERAFEKQSYDNYTAVVAEIGVN